jgi:hypothetical protein
MSKAPRTTPASWPSDRHGDNRDSQGESAKAPQGAVHSTAALPACSKSGSLAARFHSPSNSRSAARAIPPPAAHSGSGPLRDRPRRDGALDPCGGLDESERALFNHLRERRAKQAQDEGLPAYSLPKNEQLLAIGRHDPEPLNALGHIDGIGPGKAERGGMPARGAPSGSIAVGSSRNRVSPAARRRTSRSTTAPTSGNRSHPALRRVIGVPSDPPMRAGRRLGRPFQGSGLTPTHDPVRR